MVGIAAVNQGTTMSAQEIGLKAVETFFLERYRFNPLQYLVPGIYDILNDSQFIADLNANGEDYMSDFVQANIISRCDQIIAPHKSDFTSYGHNYYLQDLCPDAIDDHFSMTTSWPVMQWVVNMLERRFDGKVQCDLDLP